MIDRKRLILIVAGASALILIIVALVVALILVGSKDQAQTSEPSPGAGPTEEVEPTATPEKPVITFTDEQSKIVRKVAQAAVTWSSATDPSVMVTQYVEAGMSESLAQDFTPIWAEAFGSEARVAVTAAKLGEPTVTDYIPGKEKDTGIFVVSIAITYEGTLNKDGTTTPIGYTDAIWQFALDERYNTVTQIIQPPLSEIAGLR